MIFYLIAFRNKLEYFIDIASRLILNTNDENLMLHHTVFSFARRKEQSKNPVIGGHLKP